MSNDTWATPPEIFHALDLEFRFGFDVCAEHSTAKCPEYWTIDDDALKQDWAKAGGVFGQWLWCNPPYSNPFPFIKKAIEAQLAGRGTVMLLNHDMSNEWGAYLLPYVTEIRVLIASGSKADKTYQNGRIGFIKNGRPAKDNPKGQVVLVFDPHRIGYCHTTYVAKTALMAKGAIDSKERAA